MDTSLPGHHAPKPVSMKTQERRTSEHAVKSKAPDGEASEDDTAQVRALSEDEARRFLAQSAESQHAALFALALDSGMRPSEYLALRWSDLSDDCRMVTVRRKAEVLRKQTNIKNTLKAKQSRRTLPLAEGTAELLRAHQDRARFASGGANGNIKDALVFPNERGGVLGQGNLNRRHFKPLLRAAGIDDSHRPYDLRHTMATLLLNAGVNVKTVSARLGHANIVLTLNTYAHCLQEHQEAAAAAMQSIMFDARRAG